MEHEGDSDTNSNWCTWYDPQGLNKKAGRVGNRKMSRDHPNYGIVDWFGGASGGVMVSKLD